MLVFNEKLLYNNKAELIQDNSSKNNLKFVVDVIKSLW